VRARTTRAERAITRSARVHQDRIAHASTTYEKFAATCDWLYAAARRAGTLDSAIEDLHQMITECERKAATR
jgi:hypothetical protein